MTACTDRPAGGPTPGVLRGGLRAARRAVTAAERRRAGGRVADVVRHAELLGPGDVVGVYLADDGELDTRDLVDVIVAIGATPALPVTQTGSAMTFRTWFPDEPLVAGRFGIAVPAAGETVPPCGLDVVFVPSVGFDPGGRRLGRGAGYYDRAFDRRLREGPPPLLVGVGYDAQIVAEIGVGDHDVLLDAVVTPTGLRRTRVPMVVRRPGARQD